MKWQPIETAPTDGTRILLCGRDGKIADGHYGQPDGFANPKRFVWPYINANPTHWAPLALIAAAEELLAAAMKVNALSIQTDAHKELRAAIANATGDDDAAPECTCAAKDMTFGRCCKVENEMDDPNMHAYGEDGPDDAEIGRQWRENSSLEKWFPFTAEQLEAKERENLHLAREARTWWEACRDATGEAERLRGETDVLRAWIKVALVPLQSIADLEDFEDGGDGMNALIDAGRKFVRWSGLFGGNVNTSRGPASSIGTPPTGNCGQCQWSAGRARSETRRIDKETEMHLSNLERYEIQAEAFRRMTGHLAPGKDAAAGSYDEAANRTEIYARWAEIHGECVYAVLDAVDCVLRAAEDDEK